MRLTELCDRKTNTHIFFREDGSFREYSTSSGIDQYESILTCTVYRHRHMSTAVWDWQHITFTKLDHCSLIIFFLQIAAATDISNRNQFLVWKSLDCLIYPEQAHGCNLKCLIKNKITNLRHYIFSLPHNLPTSPI